MALKISNDLRDGIKDALRDLYYPIGTLFTSNKNTNPNTFIGGTWVAVTNDYLLNFITSGTGGGYTGNSNSASDNTTLTINQMPSHGHGRLNWNGGVTVSLNTGGSAYHVNWERTGYDSDGFYMPNAGGGQGHNHPLNLKKLNMYGWIRTA